MVISEVVNNSSDVLPDVLVEIGKIGLWLQAVGAIVIFWVIFQSINLYFNRKRRKTLYKISSDLKRVEGKLDKILSKKK